MIKVNHRSFQLCFNFVLNVNFKRFLKKKDKPQIISTVVYLVFKNKFYDVITHLKNGERKVKKQIARLDVTS